MSRTLRPVGFLCDVELRDRRGAQNPDLQARRRAAVRKAMAHRTTIAIAHRLSTIRDADVIVVMQNGRILQQGTHAQLEVQDGAYKEFMRLSYAS